VPVVSAHARAAPLDHEERVRGRPLAKHATAGWNVDRRGHPSQGPALRPEQSGGPGQQDGRGAPGLQDDHPGDYEGAAENLAGPRRSANTKKPSTGVSAG
jgi:hypothetical protein